MKLITTLLLFSIIPFLGISQRAEVKIEFTESICIQDLENPIRYGLYEAVMCDTKGTLTFYVYCEGDDEVAPMNLIVHTEDNNEYVLTIIPTCNKIPTQSFNWARRDTIVDLTTVKCK